MLFPFFSGTIFELDLKIKALLGQTIKCCWAFFDDCGLVYRSAVSVPAGPASEGEHAASAKSCSGETPRSNATVRFQFLHLLHDTRQLLLVPSQTSKKLRLMKTDLFRLGDKMWFRFSLTDQNMNFNFFFFPLKLPSHSSDLIVKTLKWFREHSSSQNSQL